MQKRELLEDFRGFRARVNQRIRVGDLQNMSDGMIADKVSDELIAWCRSKGLSYKQSIEFNILLQASLKHFP